ncbi:MAG TPA: DUF4157 domain-containing protein [Dehalococcoidia bacterium]|nr:DUF4157 domain-containing protein [Dehalococcoidia bacterium]
MKLETGIIDKLQHWFPEMALDGVHVVTSGPVCWFVRNVQRQGAMTFAPFIFYGRDPFDPISPRGIALLAHELKHVQQYRELGHFAFLATYLLDMVKARFKYSRDLPLEAPAYALQRQVRESLES